MSGSEGSDHARHRVTTLLPRILAARATQIGGDAVPLELALSALSGLLVELNDEMIELSTIVTDDDPRLQTLARAVHRIADSVTLMLDTIGRADFAS